VHVRDNLTPALVLAAQLLLPFASMVRFPHELLNSAVPLRHLTIISSKESLPYPGVSDEVDDGLWRPRIRRRLSGTRQIWDLLDLQLAPPMPPQRASGVFPAVASSRAQSVDYLARLAL
jgi:hypothetical protein